MMYVLEATPTVELPYSVTALFKKKFFKSRCGPGGGGGPENGGNKKKNHL